MHNLDKKTILAFGHIPSWAGGKQESGLANVIYNLALSMSRSNDVNVILAATDCNFCRIKRESLTIVGWQKKSLFLYVISHPFFSLTVLFNLLFDRIKYKDLVDIIPCFFKSVFLRKIIKEYNPNIIHLHGAHSLIYLHPIPKNVKVVLTHHGIIGNNELVSYYQDYAKLEYDSCNNRRINKLYFISNQLINDFSHLYGKISIECEAILDAYDSSQFYYIEHVPQKTLVLATVASFSENKGQIRVVEAIGKSNVRCKYICIGASTEEELKRVKDAVQEYKIDFEYLGKKAPADIRLALSNIDYMIMPSGTEGFGLAFLEAIACGVPVILPKNLPIVSEPDIIVPNENAILLNDYSVKSISEVIKQLSNYSFDHKRVSQTVIQFSWNNIGKKYNESMLNLFNK